MDRLDPASVAAWLDRWTVVRRQEIRESRATPTEVRFHQLAALFASRDLFPPEARAEQECAALRRRWILIRAAIHARPGP